MTSAAPPKRRCQRRWLMIATGPAGPPPATSSAGVNVRPRNARTPSVSKKSPLTHWAYAGSASSPIVSSDSAHASAPATRWS